MIEEKEKEFACLFLQSDLSKINPENNYQVTGGNLQEHTRTDRAGAAGPGGQQSGALEISVKHSDD